MTQTILHLLDRNSKTRATTPAYHEKINGTWRATNWKQYRDQVWQAARALIALGLTEGDIVTILGFNRSEWVILDLASMLIGGAPAGIYTSNAPSEVEYIIHHAESKLILVEDMSQWEKVDKVRDRLPALRHIVLMKGVPAPADPQTLTWEQFMAQGDKVAAQEVDMRLAKLRMDQLATLIYTSGTTGPPKGVMLSHDNLAWTAEKAVGLVSATSADSSLSYLPLSHIAEQMFSIHAAIAAGYQIYFAESPLKVADNLKEVEPTILFGVPRVWERFYNGVSARLAEAHGVRANLIAWARNVGTQVTDLRNQGQQPGGLLGLQYKLAARLVFSKLHTALGLSRARVMVSGAAPIPKQILDFFGSLDLRIHEVYGQSEGSGPTTFNRLNATKFGSVGPAYPGVEVRLTDEGEIIARGRNVFMGYYKEPEATANTLNDGWLYSGDLGRFDDEGYLYITGRKKDIIITSGGKNIAPKNIEAALTALELISSAIVIGEQQRYLVALLTLEPEAAKRFAEANGVDVATLHDHPLLKEELKKVIAAQVNSQFARVEQVRNFVVLNHDFSVETGELTPTFKIKRNVVNKMYADVIERAYAAGQIM